MTVLIYCIIKLVATKQILLVIFFHLGLVKQQSDVDALAYAEQNDEPNREKSELRHNQDHPEEVNDSTESHRSYPRPSFCIVKDHEQNLDENRCSNLDHVKSLDASGSRGS